MNPLTTLLDDWRQRQLLTPAQRAALEQYERNRPVSLYFLLRALLYAGILLFTAGAAILIYKNIDTIGHDALIAVLALLTVGCFYYTYRHSAPFSVGMTDNESKLTDFVLLIGATLFLSLEGYVQWRYNLFGTRYGLATMIPAVLFLFCAYRFDHRGVLSMGLTALASWVGLTVTPLEVMTGNDFGNESLMYTAVGFGIVTVGVSLWLDRRNIKRHFTFTYLLLGGNLLFISALAGLFTSQEWYVFVPVLGLSCWYFFKYAQQEQSFLFLLMAVVYGYIAFTYLLFRWVDDADIWFSLGSLYFIGSSVGVILFIINYKKLLRQR
ncbi:MAG: DUF2157 domain-containing protein [Spirosomataceae bacterium]